MSKRLPRELPILGLLLAIICMLTGFVPAFRTPENLTAVGENAAFIGIMACGETLVILGGGLDLSVGSMLALSSCTTAMVLAAGKNWPIAVLAGIVVGAAAGLFNGALITRRHLPPILTTLATLLLFRHGISIATQARAYGPFPDAFNAVGVGWIPLGVFAAVTALCATTCSRTKFGRWNLAIGGSEQSARLSAVPVERVKRSAYLICGLCAGLSGWILMAYNNNAQSSVGTGSELDVIAACVVGGVRITGGDGSVVGAALGAVLIALLRNALILTGRPTEQYGLFAGAVILIAALLEGWRERRKARISFGVAAA